MPAGNLGQPFVKAKAAHIVQDACARADGCFGNHGLGGVNGDRRSWQAPPDALNDLQYAPQFFFGTHGPGSRTGGFAPHVDPVCALAHHLRRVANGTARIQEPAAIRKRIWSDVQDSHDKGSGPEPHGATRHNQSMSFPQHTKGFVPSNVFRQTSIYAIILKMVKGAGRRK